MSEVFISHASADDVFVAELRRRLEAQGVPVWVDSRRLRGGDKLAPEIEKAITEAAHFLVVLSEKTFASSWVTREVEQARKVQRARGEDYRVVPLLRPGLTPETLRYWFPDEEPVAVAVREGPTAMIEAMPAILTALGEDLPTDNEPLPTPAAPPVAELVLHLSDPRIATEDGTRRATADARLEYDADRKDRSTVVSRRFRFTAPLGPIEAEELTWYLERYVRWPFGVFRERARGVEAELEGWGQKLFVAAVGHEKPRAVLEAWRHADPNAQRRFSVLVDDDAADDVAAAEAAEATTALLSLPWELLRDDTTWLFQDENAVRVRRRLPNYKEHAEHRTGLPVRILLVSPRPEQDVDGRPVGYLDHRVSALPLVEAVESLGELARLTVLHPPTYASLAKALAAGDEGESFDVLHFDGHGVYDRRRGLGGLCFERPVDGGLRHRRVLDFVGADRLAGLVRAHRIPLVFLEACQTAVAEVDPTSSVAAQLLNEGVSSVVAMTHSVLVETARRFVVQFYADLATGSRVGTAMLAGQRALFDDPARGAIPGAGELRLQDWFVPVLYQERLDPQPIGTLPSQAVERLAERGRRVSLGALPEPPEHRFHGRSRDLLALERHLHTHPWVVIRGTGGQGKTTLAVELVRWLVRTRRAERSVFVPVEHVRDPAAVLDTIGRQLLGEGYSVAHHSDLDRALQPVERALRDQATIVLVDNCETLFPDRTDPTDLGGPDEAAVAAGGDTAAGVFAVLQRLLAADRRARVVFTSRELLPAPFADPAAVWELGALDRDDAVALVTQVLTREGKAPPVSDAGATAEEVTALVEAVGCHARALVLLAPETARAGVAATTRDLQQLMARLQQAHPRDRANSLYASVALSLRRLPPDLRGHVGVLAACHGGIHLAVLAELTGLDVDAMVKVAGVVIGVGLGEDLGDGCLGLDPGLAPYLRGELDATVLDGLRERWADATSALTEFLYQQRFQDVGWAARVTRRLLPELLALLEWAAAHQPPEQVVGLATRIEDLVRNLGQPRTLAHVARTRTEAAARLGGWGHARFLAADAEVDRLLEQGQWPAALAAAQQLLAHVETGGQDAYPEAAYNLAMTHFTLGRVLRLGGAAEDALTPSREARRRFQQLAATGNNPAEQMAGKALAEIAWCLLDLGRWEQAADAYKEAAAHATRLGDARDAAIANMQLGTVRLQQGRYPEALAGYTAAREVFEKLAEPRSVAVIWHQIGMLHQEEERFESAEQAYQHSLALKVQQNNQAGQANTLNQLGTLYDKQGRLEEAVRFYRQAADIYVRSGDLANEGKGRHNLADTLLRLGRHDQARSELQRAIECGKPYGHALEPWKTWELLERLERASDHPDAAHTARHQAITTYLAYRHAGGGSQHPAIGLFDHVAQAITERTPEQAARDLTNLLQPDTGPRITTLVQILQALLAGDPVPARTDHADLEPRDVAELHLLLASLAEPPPETTDG